MHLTPALTILSLLSTLPTPSTALPTVQHILSFPSLQDITPEFLKDKYTGTKRPTSAQVLKVLEKAEVIPTVLDVFHPSFLVNVTWGPHASAALGNLIAVDKLQDRPEVILEEPREGKKKKKKHGSGNDEDDDDDDDGKDADKNQNLLKRTPTAPLNNLVITMTDPDAPTRSNPEWSEMCHWIAIGLPMNLSDSSTTTTTTTTLQPFKDIVEYKPPGPPATTGKHRYVLTAWAPANGTTTPLDLVAPKERQHWGRDGYGGVRDWAKEMGLAPIGANFIYAEHD